VGFCLIASIIVATSEYLGSPINCQGSASQFEADVYNAYCRIHGGKKITDKGKNIFKCTSNQTNLEKAGANDTLYYQWVIFMLVINALLFKIPHLLWKSLEEGIMKKFHSGKDLKSYFVTDDGDMKEHLKTHVAFFKKLSKKSGKNIKYYAKFQTCQLLNIVMLILNFWATDQFLTGGFSWYGPKAVTYMRSSPGYREGSQSPMCETFPTVVGCKFSAVGAAGSETSDHGICILSQNAINEKIYLFLWFWFLLLIIASVLQLIYEIAILSIGAFRSWMMEQQFGGTDDPQMKDFVQNLGLGDWFVLYQIGKNTSEEFFHKLIQKLSGSKANDVEENAPLMDVTIDSGNGMELRQRNQAE